MVTRPDAPVVVLSHRGPVSFRQEGSRRTVRRGSGGLVTALVGLAGELEDAVWVCSAVTDEDAKVAGERGGGAVPVLMTTEPRLLGEGETPDGPSLNVRMVDVDRSQHEDFYTVVSNPLLWFVQHGLYGLATAPVIGKREHEAFDEGYVPVNDAFADAVVAEVEQRGGRALVFLHDYHFYLVAQRVRERCPDVVLSHFVHIPWPGPDGWRVLPADMRDRLLLGLLGNDVVAFHTRRFARNFLLCAQELLGLPIDLRRMSVQVGDRTVYARSYPISIDVESLEQLAASPRVAELSAELEQNYLCEDHQLIVRIDRTDPSKNVVRGFLAFEYLLDQHPELVGKVTFLAMLQPSRTDVPEYIHYIQEIGAITARVNAAHARRGYAAIDLRLQEDLPLAVAAYSVCDALMVNSVADGMNLVAKEAVTVSRRNGVLLLSESAGAHEELGHYAVTVHPFDVQQQADALYEALTMGADERRDRREAAADVVRRNDVANWLERQIDDLAELTGMPTKAG
ncbi:MAG: trehalose-6-phosphate synthase [Actinomycetota bacterium]|nr:trehalose-6-phosphate synthase [Actinomycetota bacterium]